MTRPETLRFVVVVPHRNGAERLHATLQSVIFASGANDALVVVDNASTDGSADILARDFPAVRWWRNDRNHGFAAACNQGASAADSEFLLFLNSDALLPQDALNIFEEFFRRHPEAGQVGVRLVGEDGRLQRASAPAPDFWSECGLRRRIPRGFRDPQCAARVETLVGACVAMPRVVFENLAGWDERFFFYEEDVDLSVRVSEAGYQVWFLPDIAVKHAKGGSTRSVRLPARLEALRSRLLYIGKHFPLWQRVILLPARLLSVGLNTLGAIFGLVSTLGLNQAARHKAMLWLVSFVWVVLLMRPKWNLAARG
jgi:GT2 family glycosyltransferase